MLRPKFIILIGSICFLGIGIHLLPFVKDLQPFETFKQSQAHSDATFFDRNGEPLQSVRYSYKKRSLGWIPLEHISTHFIDLVINTEDKNFYSHSGIDYLALAKAAYRSVAHNKIYGASTISMQFAKQLIPDHQKMNRIRYKILQMRTAQKLENLWTKKQILEAYLNIVSYRSEVQGILTASKALFKKYPSSLNHSESALLAALIKSPSANSQMIARRACIIVKHNPKNICAEIKRLAEDRLNQKVYLRYREHDIAPHLAQKLINERPNQTSYNTTLDKNLQIYVHEMLKNNLSQINQQNVHDAAVLVVKNETGEVLAYVGGSSEYSQARYVDGIMAKRQAGSTLKPFIYGLAINNKTLTAASLLSDAPLEIAVAGGSLYRPQNYNHKFNGDTTVRLSLASSLNLPAVRALQLIGADPVLDLFGQMNFGKIETAEHYGPSLALGSFEISLWEITNAYRMLANRGQYQPLTTIKKNTLPSPTPLLSPESSFIIGDILSDRDSRVLTFGPHSNLDTSFFSAVKTGTSKDMRDNWCIGYSEHFTVGVWVGNFHGEPMWNVSGVSGAGPIWSDIIHYLHRSKTSEKPSAPKSLVQKLIRQSHSKRPYKEWFLKGTEPLGSRIQVAKIIKKNRITYPTNGATFAIDPDIPATLQKIPFESLTLQPHSYFTLNHQRLKNKNNIYEWAPKRGPHRLSLYRFDGQLLDKIDFEVR